MIEEEWWEREDDKVAPTINQMCIWPWTNEEIYWIFPSFSRCSRHNLKRNHERSVTSQVRHKRFSDNKEIIGSFQDLQGHCPKSNDSFCKQWFLCSIYERECITLAITDKLCKNTEKTRQSGVYINYWPKCTALPYYMMCWLYQTYYIEWWHNLSLL